MNNTNIKLMIDLFHLQLIKGNIANTLEELKSYIGHVQVSIIPIIKIHQVRIMWAILTPNTINKEND